MKHILVPTDFSHCANNATTYAFEIAKRTGGTIHLLHVIYPTEGVDSSVYNAVWFDDYLDARKKSLEDLAQVFRDQAAYSKVVVKCEVQVGYPASCTDTYADDIHADLIVMGTTGGTGLAGTILGSTSRTLLSKTKRPAFIIPAEATYKDATPVTFATDFNMDLSHKTLEALHDFVHVHHAKLKVVHVLDKPGEKVDRDKEAAIHAQLKGIHHDFHYIHDADVPQAINDYLEATDSNTLVTVAHKHQFWHKLLYESVSKALAQHTRIPTLVLHDKK